MEFLIYKVSYYTYFCTPNKKPAVQARGIQNKFNVYANV